MIKQKLKVPTESEKSLKKSKNAFASENVKWCKLALFTFKLIMPKQKYSQ